MSNEKPMAMTVKDVADELQLCQDTVRRMIRRGDLRAVKFGSSYRIHRSDVENFFSAEGKKNAEETSKPEESAPRDPCGDPLAGIGDRWRLNTIKR